MTAAVLRQISRLALAHAHPASRARIITPAPLSDLTARTRHHFCLSASSPRRRASSSTPRSRPSGDPLKVEESYTDTPRTAGPANRLLPEFSLDGKVVVVSGGARGLGLTMAEACLEAGAVGVYALDRLPEPSPDFSRVRDRAAAELGTSLHYRSVDVLDVPALTRIVHEIGSAHDRLDGLIAAAGIQQEIPALEYTADDANRMFAVNVTGVFMTAQAVAREMIRFGRGGSMVLIASMSGTVANRGLICPAYNASKAGVQQLARSLAAEWGFPHRIRVNSLSPGYIVTAMVEALFETHPERRTEWAAQNMLGRLSEPREYRGAGVFLLSEASAFMTGADLRVDGGHCAW